jgi:hypothetical protein
MMMMQELIDQQELIITMSEFIARGDDKNNLSCNKLGSDLWWPIYRWVKAAS